MMRTGSFITLVAVALLATCSVAQSGPGQSPFQSHEVHADGSITFRYSNAAAKDVELDLDVAPRPLAMTKDATGVWSVTTAPMPPEIYGYSFKVDGVTELDPLNNYIVRLNRAFLTSQVLVPGHPAMPWELTDIPHGQTTHVTFTTHVAKNLPENQSAYIVYTPPHYDPNKKGGYPVLYLLHGWSDSENAWDDTGHANYMLDSMIDSGKAVPMIVVMPLGYGDLHFVEDGWTVWQQPDKIVANTALFSKELLTEVMPAVEAEYNVAKGRENRAIAGLSMGGLESLSIGLNNPQTFAWVGGMSAALVGVSDGADYTRFVPGLAAPGAAQKDDLRLLWIACGTDDALITTNRAFVAWTRSKGLAPVAVETPGKHVWEVWHNNLLHLAPLLFRQ
jgi:enterochelin esterase family protein